MDAPLSSGRDRRRSRSRSRSRSRQRSRGDRERYDGLGGYDRQQRGHYGPEKHSRREDDRYGPDRREDHRRGNHRDHGSRRDDRRDNGDFRGPERDFRQQHSHRDHHPPAASIPSHRPIKHSYRINTSAPPDTNLPNTVKEDPRGSDPTKRITKKAKGRGNGRNTESFDPADTLVRPDLRVWVGSREKKVFDKRLKHDDGACIPVVIAHLMPIYQLCL